MPLTRPETVPSQGPKRPLGVREPPRQPNRPGNPPNPEPGPGALACRLGRNQREGFPSRQFWVKPDRLLECQPPVAISDPQPDTTPLNHLPGGSSTVTPTSSQTQEGVSSYDFWRDDGAVFLPRTEIDKRLHNLRMEQSLCLYSLLRSFPGDRGLFLCPELHSANGIPANW